MEALVKSCNICWVWSGIPNVLRNNKAPISPEKVELFCLFVACSYTSTEATMLLCSYGWV